LSYGADSGQCGSPSGIEDDHPGARREIVGAQLQAHHRTIFSPESQKSIRSFSAVEASKLLGIAEGYLAPAGRDRQRPPLQRGAAQLHVEDIHEIRKQLDQGARENRAICRTAAAVNGCRSITVMNFKGGSGKTTTAAHLDPVSGPAWLSHLAIDLDPRPVCRHFRPSTELDVGLNETLFGAIRYDDEKRPIAEIIRQTTSRSARHSWQSRTPGI